MIEFWYLVAQRVFDNKEYVSTALLQCYLQIEYQLARKILNRMIEAGFCEPQIGAKPCKVLHLAN